MDKIQIYEQEKQTEEIKEIDVQIEILLTLKQIEINTRK